MQAGSEGQTDHCLGVNHMGSCWLKAVLSAWRGSFSAHHGMLCWQGLLPEIRDKLERRLIRRFEVKMEIVEVLFHGC